MTRIFQPRRLAHLFAADTRNVGRDPTLAFALVFSIVPAVLIYFFGAPIDTAAREAFGIESIVFYALPSLLCLPGALVGWVAGFLFLEDRDDGPLLALDITPVGKRGFIAYRTGATMAVTFAVTLVAARFILPDRGAALHLFIAALVALQALIAAIVLPAVARNKVEGLALSKLTNIAIVAPLVAIVPSPLRYLAGVVPSFWIGELMGLSSVAYLPLPVSAVLALIVHIAVALLLYRLMARHVG